MVHKWSRDYVKYNGVNVVKVYIFISGSVGLKVTSAKKRSLLEMCYLRHMLRIFLFRTKIMFCFQDIQVFVFLSLQLFTKSVTS